MNSETLSETLATAIGLLGRLVPHGMPIGYAYALAIALLGHWPELVYWPGYGFEYRAGLLAILIAPAVFVVKQIANAIILAVNPKAQPIGPEPILEPALDPGAQRQPQPEELPK